MTARLVVVAVVGALVGAVAAQPTGDAFLFARAGATLFSRHAAQLFADPTLQIGPVYAVLTGVADRLALALHLDALPVIGAVMSALVAVSAALLVPHTRRLLEAPWPEAELAAGLAVALAGPTGAASVCGHSEELLAALAIFAAAIFAAARRPVLAGTLVGIAGATKLWGLLGVAVIVLAVAGDRPWPALRRVAGGVAAAVAVVGCCYAPFAILGRVATFDFQWRVGLPAPLGLVLADGHPFTFGWRIGQGLLAVALGTVAALLAKGRPEVAWTVPVTVVAARLLVDPFPQMYYVAALTLCVLVGVWSSAGADRLPALAAVSAVAPLSVGLFAAVGGVPGAAVIALALSLVIAAMLAVARGVAWNSAAGTPVAVRAMVTGTGHGGEQAQQRERSA